MELKLHGLKVRSGPYLYVVQSDAAGDRRLDDITDDGDPTTIGYCDSTSGALIVRSTMTRHAQVETLYHELMHADFWTGRITTDDEERVVKTLAPIQLDTLQRNPKLRRVLFGE